MSTTHTAVFENAILKSTELKADTKIAVGLDTEQTTKELTVVGDAPEIRIQDKTGSNPEVNQTTLSIVADGGVTHFRAGTSTFDTTETKGDIKFQSSTGDSTHAIITGTGRVGVGTMAPTESLDIVGNINLQKVSNTATIKLDSNVVTEFTRSKKLIKYPRVAMTAATTSGYTASASTNYSGASAAWQAFDGLNDPDADSANSWDSGVNSYTNATPGVGQTSSFDSKTGEYINLKLPDKIRLSSYQHWTRMDRDHEGPHKGFLYGSNDGFSTYKLLHSFDNIVLPTTSMSVTHVHQVNAEDYYDEYRLLVTETQASTYLNIAELAFYGIPEYDPEAHGTDVIMRSVPNVPNTDWLEVYYDGQDYTSMPSTVTDKSGNGVTGTPNGVTFDSTWKAFSFDGVDDSVTGTVSSLSVPCSVSTWVKLDNKSSTQTIFSLGTYAQNSTVTAYITATLVQIVGYNNDKSWVYDFPIGQWVHFTLVYKGGGLTSGDNVSFYVNGNIGQGAVSVYTAGGATSTTDTVFPSPCNVLIGRESSNATFGGPMSVANFRLFNRALTTDEVWQLYAYQKEYFQVSPDVVTFKGGRLGIGTLAPTAPLDVMGVPYGPSVQPAFLVSTTETLNRYFGTSRGDAYVTKYNSPLPIFGLSHLKYNINNCLSFHDYAGRKYIKFTAPADGIYHFGLMFQFLQNAHSAADYVGFGFMVNKEGAYDSTLDAEYTQMDYYFFEAVSTNYAVNTTIHKNGSVDVMLKKNDFVVYYARSVNNSLLQYGYSAWGHIVQYL